MDPIDEIVFEYMPFFRTYKSGKIERLFGTDSVAPTLTGVDGASSKDVVIDPLRGVSARLFLPVNALLGKKLPVLAYFHGGAFCACSPFCAIYHFYLTNLVAKANIVAVSVNYRLAPEHPLPAAYVDSWNALKWVASHNAGRGPESWLNDYADLGRAFLAGDDAGANISHNMAVRAGFAELPGMRICAACIIHPDFVGKEGFLNKVWNFICPDTTSGEADPRINPAKDSRLANVGCSRILVCVAEKDGFRDAGWIYYHAVRKSGWKGHIEINEIIGEDHIFHLFHPTKFKATHLMETIVFFVNSVTQMNNSNNI